MIGSIRNVEHRLIKPPLRAPKRAAVLAMTLVAIPYSVAIGQSGQLPGEVPSTLTIAQAVAIARRNNPDFQSTRNNARNAALDLRAARGALLPQLSSSLTGQYQQGGQQFFSGVSLGSNSDVLQSQYSIGINYTLSGANLIAPRVQRATSAAVEQDISGADVSLQNTVKQDYITALQSKALSDLNDSLVANAQVQLDLAKAKATVGTGTLLDVQRAEVALGQQKVALLQAQNQHQIDKLRLFQEMGVDEPANVQLVSNLTVGDSLPALPQLIAMAQSQNPNILALRDREHVASLNVAKERTEYMPTLSLSTGIGGYTYAYRDPNFLINQAQAETNSERASCISTQEVRQAVGLPNTLPACQQIQFTSADAAALRAQNSLFPFDFSHAPRSITAAITLPIFDGFGREQRLQEAEVARENARYTTRSRELQVKADVTSAYLSLQTALQTVKLQEENSAKAKEELTFIQDEYAVGLSTFVDLTTSRAAYAQAENDRINAVYNYHKAVAALENAVGRPLR